MCPFDVILSLFRDLMHESKSNLRMFLETDTINQFFSFWGDIAFLMGYQYWKIILTPTHESPSLVWQTDNISFGYILPEVMKK